jgi:hypothetical protein
VLERRALYVLREEFDRAGAIRWPSKRYRDDPVGYFRDILGIEPWSEQQRVIEAVHQHPRVAWKSGRRVSKSNTEGGIGLWFYSCFEDARATFTAPVMRQVDGILWRETRMMKMRSGKCIRCRIADPDDTTIKRPCPHSAIVTGRMGDRAATGLTSVDEDGQQTFREIRGYTADKVESIIGTAGKNLFFGIDEASGVSDEIFEGIEGNRAGWSTMGSGTVRMLLTGNPTRTSGTFYDAHEGDKKTFYFCITTSSEQSPNVVEGREVIPGLATREWIEEMGRMWGKESALYIIHVLGQYATKEDGKIFSVHTIAQAEARWEDTEAAGRLYIGLDPSGPSGSGDECVFAPRRGQKLLELLALLGLTEDAILAHLLAMIGRLKVPRETPVVVVDREGSVGSAVFGLFRSYLQAHPHAFELIGIRASDRAARQPDIYDRQRDALTANLEVWIREGGAILTDVKLAKEMHEHEWQQQASGRLKVTPKLEVKKKIGRSPDRYDALALAVWEPLSLREVRPTEREDDERPAPDGRPVIDPYGGGTIDPWG